MEPVLKGMARSKLLIALAAPLLAVGCDGAPAGTPSDTAAADVRQLGAPIVQTGFVTDAAGVLDDAAEQRLTARLHALEQVTHHQMVIVTTPSLGGEDILFYTVDLARRWGIGRKGHNDGVVVLVAPNERKVRISVGYGLESTLTDPRCKEIIEQDMLPTFKQGDFAGGLERGVDSLVALLR
ncbi:TPM domain-containing protein [Novosphingobium sp. fls2-241-R2A-195]|uniref:TPM domain-containing protein n=1 Tax=Novosphingobium sp. fls2-241-R2A-195 TaxID=3040296 RepID=UPI00254D4714|nr:TPM domain-containing protein [Novosphingobium sp. fls2-241-R2A-195]